MIHLDRSPTSSARTYGLNERQAPLVSNRTKLFIVQAAPAIVAVAGLMLAYGKRWW